MSGSTYCKALNAVIYSLSGAIALVDAMQSEKRNHTVQTLPQLYPSIRLGALKERARKANLKTHRRLPHESTRMLIPDPAKSKTLRCKAHAGTCRDRPFIPRESLRPQEVCVM